LIIGVAKAGTSSLYAYLGQYSQVYTSPDYPAYFRQHGGATLVTTIDKYTYVTVRPLIACFDHRIGVHYGCVEQVCTVAEIQHPAVRACLRFLDLQQGIEIQRTSDLPKPMAPVAGRPFLAYLLQKRISRLAMRSVPWWSG
jgi:hypothetical protein